MKIEVFPLQTIQSKGAQSILLIVHLNGHSLQIMLDCGLNQQMDSANIRHYANKIQKSKLILLSQSALEFAGGIPLVAEYQIPTLATIPVVEYGFRNFMDQYINLQGSEDMVHVIETVEQSYQQIKKLNLGQAQQFNFENGLFHVTVVPIRAGKTIGACAWRIQINTMNVIYLPDFSMQKELHIDSLNVEKLITKNTANNISLSKEKLDLLIVDNYPIPNHHQETQSVFKLIEEQVNLYAQHKKGQLIFAFYPNERILEGIMALDQIFNENSRLNLKCELLTTYLDIIEKARGQTDFLGSSLVNWKQQDMSQSPFDSEYLKAKFQMQKGRGQVILATFNALFSGPHYQDQYLSDSNNTIVFIGTPPTYLNDHIGKVKGNYKGEINLRLGEQQLHNIEIIQKHLMKQQKEEKPALSSTYLPGSTVDIPDSQSIMLQSDEIQEEAIAAPILNKHQYKGHPIFDEVHQEKIVFVQSSNPLRPMHYLHCIDDYGADIPDFIQRDTSIDKQMQTHQQLQIQEEQQDQQQKQLSQQNFILPTPNKPAQVNVQCKIIIRQVYQSVSNTEMLLQVLNPGQIFLLNPATKPKHCKYQLQIAKKAESTNLVQQRIPLDMPFVQANQVNACAVRVKGKISVSFATNLKCILTMECAKLDIGHSLKLIELYQQLSRIKNLALNLGFSQISVNNGQLVISRTGSGFKVEGILSFQIDFSPEPEQPDIIPLSVLEDGIKFEDRYEVLQTLGMFYIDQGEGAHAIVKLVRSRANGQKYAVKVVRNSSEEVQANVRKCFNNTRCLRHPNIIQDIELFIDERFETSYLIMEYCAFATLESVLQTRALSEDETRNVIRQLLLATAHAHSKGICHRDIKPDNILILDESSSPNTMTSIDSRQPTLKLVDFGVSKRCAAKGVPITMSTNTGNIHYNAPEIYSQTSYTQAIDLWSVGVVMFRCLTQQLPFVSNQTHDLILILNDPSKWDFHTKIKYFSASAQNLICRLLQFDPLERISAAEALEHSFFKHVTLKDLISMTGLTQKIINTNQCMSACNSMQLDSKWEQLLQSINVDKNDIQLADLFQEVGNIHTIRNQRQCNGMIELMQSLGNSTTTAFVKSRSELPSSGKIGIDANSAESINSMTSDPFIDQIQDNKNDRKMMKCSIDLKDGPQNHKQKSLADFEHLGIQEVDDDCDQ